MALFPCNIGSSGGTLSDWRVTLTANANSSSYSSSVTIPNSDYSIKTIKVISKSSGTPTIAGTTVQPGNSKDVSTLTSIILKLTLSSASAGTSGNAVFSLNP